MIPNDRKLADALIKVLSEDDHHVVRDAHDALLGLLDAGIGIDPTDGQRGAFAVAINRALFACDLRLVSLPKPDPPPSRGWQVLDEEPPEAEGTGGGPAVREPVPPRTPSSEGGAAADPKEAVIG